MDAQNTISAKELATLNIKGIKIANPYGALLGEPEKNAVIFIWGEKEPENPPSVWDLPTRWPSTDEWNTSPPKSISGKPSWIG